MTVTPQGQLYLCKTPLENDYKNQLTFSNENAQLSYFNTTIQKTLTEYTYIKKDSVIKVGLNIDEIINCNYLFYRNTGFTNKWYYCFITNMEYINENCTSITFETDVFQTWYFNINFNKTFVEREHVSDDTIGLHTVPESLELGDYTTSQNCTKLLSSPSDFYICMAVTELPDESLPPYNNNRTYNGIFGGLYYLVFKTASDCELAIKMYDIKSKADAINSLFMVPKELTSIKDGTEATWTIQAIGTCNLIYVYGTDSSSTIGNLIGTMPTKLGNNYIPKNNKLFTYPYSFMNLTNNSGNTTPFRYEDFDIDETTKERAIGWWIDACLTPGMSMKALPLFYKHININYNYGVMLGKLPICSWNSDVYLNWLTQNGLNTVFDVVGSTIGLASSIGTGNVGGIVSSSAQVYNSIHEVTIVDITPNQARGNTNSGDINFSNSYDGGITLYYMSIKDEYAKIIDDYFSMYGYKVNSLKIPNITGRQNWNYVKTINCNFDGDIPQVDMDIIKNMFNNGITLWHNPNTIYNYDVSNNIV